MSAIPDEGVPRKLVKLLRQAGCEVEKFPKHWKGLKNGQLLAHKDASRVDCLITCDKNFVHHQNLRDSKVAVVVLPTQSLAMLAPKIDQIVQAISAAASGSPVVML